MSCWLHRCQYSKACGVKAGHDVAVEEDVGRPAPIRGLDDRAAQRVLADFPGDGPRILDCLRTAQTLLDLAIRSGGTARFAASAAYNVREALTDITREPRSVSGLDEVLAAWETYKISRDQPSADASTDRAQESAAWAQFDKVLSGVARDRERQHKRVKHLENLLRERTGAEPLRGASDPSVQYRDLLKRANNGLHEEISIAEAQKLFDDAVAWFGRLFAPPSVVAEQIADLAAAPYTPQRLDKFRALGTSNHHLRLLLERLEDPAWLDPLCSCGLIGLPQPLEPWPVAALTREPRRLPDTYVVDLLERLLASAQGLQDEERSRCCWEIMRTAWWLGDPGVGIVLKVLEQFPEDDLTQAVALAATKHFEPTSDVHLKVADAILGNEPDHARDHRTQEVLDRLTTGLNAENVVDRFALLARRVRRLATEPSARYLALDITALTAETDSYTDALQVLARALVRSVPVARSFGMSTASMLQLIGSIPGELGERVVCQVIAGAADIDRATKIEHLIGRLASKTATGDDDALVKDLAPFTSDETAELRTALGEPAPPPSDPDQIDDTWAKAWQWSMVLPAAVLDGWDKQIAAVTDRHGEPDPAALHQPSPRSGAYFVESPLSSEDLAALDAIEAATLVAAWRPSPSDPWGTSGLELARALRHTVEEDPVRWAAEPTAVVRTLREPIYVIHYLTGLTKGAGELGSQAPSILRAIELARAERWTPSALGLRPYENNDWSGLDTAAIETIRALANEDADLEDDLAMCWDLAERVLGDLPDDLGDPKQYDDPTTFGDPLHGAINSNYGKALQAAFALAGWEHRRHGAAGPNLTSNLDAAMAVGGAVGLQLRAVMAAGRPFLETVATDWLTANFDDLFANRKSRTTLEQTIKYSRPTRYFYDRALQPLLKAARRGVENSVAWLLIAHLWEVPGYSYEAIVSGSAGAPNLLSEIASEIARLGDQVPEDQLETTERAVVFSQRLIDDAGNHVPPRALAGLGRWAMASRLDDERWLELTERAAEATDGNLDFGVEVAQRCRDAQPSTAGLRVLTKMLGRGERWEQHHIEDVAVDALRSATRSGLDGNAVDQLLERLIERGRYGLDNG